MFASVKKAVVHGVEKTWQTIASHGESGDKPWDHEINLYKREIMMMHSAQLSENVDAETKAEAIRKIGHLAYTGGNDAAKCAGSNIEHLLQNILAAEYAPDMLRVQVLRSMSEIIRGHRENMEKARELGIVSLLIGFIRDEGEPRLSRWSCYVLVYMCTTSMVCLRDVLKGTDNIESIDESLRRLEGKSWSGWEKNYALLLREVLGFKERHNRIDPRLLAGFKPGLLS